MKKTSVLKDKQYYSEVYSIGWLAGYDALIVELFNGFGGDIPAWLLPLLAGKRAVASAARSLRATDQSDEAIFDPVYHIGKLDGYVKLLSAVEETFNEKKTEMPTFLKAICAGS